MKVFPVRVFSCCVVLLAASCRPVAAPSIPTPVPIPPLVPAPLPPPNPKLPPVPDVRGPLQISVTYPKPDQMLTVRDSNFIFGSVGTGDAALQIPKRDPEAGAEVAHFIPMVEGARDGASMVIWENQVSTRDD